MTSPEYTFNTQVPLTTFWTPPSSCSSQLPIVLAGSCDAYSCWSLNQEELTQSWTAVTNWAYWGTNNHQVAVGCIPPSSLLLPDFTYSPAIGCPIGHTTASAVSTNFNAENNILVLCCPSNFGLISSSSDRGWQCQRPVKAIGETMRMIASGVVFSEDESGSVLWAYATTSDMGTTIVVPSANPTLAVTAQAIPMVVPLTWATATPTATPAPNSGSGTNHRYSIFHLSFAASVLVTIAVAIASFVALYFALVCCLDCAAIKSRRNRALRFSRPDVERSSSPETTELKLRTCSHKSDSSCANVSDCCRCLDKRTGAMKLGARLRTYCRGCQGKWNLTDIDSLPSEWGISICSHLRAASCTGRADCCACEDESTAHMSLDQRLLRYCTHCRRYWEHRPASELPTSWDIQPCGHLTETSCLSQVDCCSCKYKESPNPADDPGYCTHCQAYWKNIDEQREKAQREQRERERREQEQKEEEEREQMRKKQEEKRRRKERAQRLRAAQERQRQEERDREEKENLERESRMRQEEEVRKWQELKDRQKKGKDDVLDAIKSVEAAKDGVEEFRGPPPTDATHGQIYDRGPKIPVWERNAPSESGLVEQEDDNVDDEERFWEVRKFSAITAVAPVDTEEELDEKGPLSGPPVLNVPITQNTNTDQQAQAAAAEDNRERPARFVSDISPATAAERRARAATGPRLLVPPDSRK